jgi:hypothetical protein
MLSANMEQEVSFFVGKKMRVEYENGIFYVIQRGNTGNFENVRNKKHWIMFTMLLNVPENHTP